MLRVLVKILIAIRHGFAYGLLTSRAVEVAAVAVAVVAAVLTTMFNDSNYKLMISIC